MVLLLLLVRLLVRLLVLLLVLVMRVVTSSVLRHLWRTGMAKAMMRILGSFVEHT